MQRCVWVEEKPNLSIVRNKPIKKRVKRDKQPDPSWLPLSREFVLAPPAVDQKSNNETIRLSKMRLSFILNHD